MRANVLIYLYGSSRTPFLSYLLRMVNVNLPPPSVIGLVDDGGVCVSLALSFYFVKHIPTQICWPRPPRIVPAEGRSEIR